MLGGMEHGDLRSGNFEPNGWTIGEVTLENRYPPGEGAMLPPIPSGHHPPNGKVMRIILRDRTSSEARKAERL